MTKHIALLAALLLAAPAAAYTDADYCRDTIRADRQSCHARHMADQADCLGAYAFDRWIDADDALAAYSDCRAGAFDACEECKALVADCPVVP